MNHSKSMHFTLRWKVALAAVLSMITIAIIPAAGQQKQYVSSQKEVADYVKDKILDGDFGNRTLWMTDTPLDQSYVARNLILDKHPDLPFPYPLTWLVMIDDNPGANFGHPVRWVFIKADLTEHTKPVKRDFPPVVLSDKGKGKAVKFQCVGVTPVACPGISEALIDVEYVPMDIETNCLYAVLVSGGIYASANYNRYRTNLRSMYQILRSAGYSKYNIYVYYADGSSLDLDNDDGDNNDATGNDVTAGALESVIRARIQYLCGNLDPDKDILFTYFSNHGADDDGVCLWDSNSNYILEPSELYSPDELAADTADCNVCRQFMIHDQCFAGDFLPMASDGNHNKLVVYAAASATEPSWGREYMAQWEQNDPNTTTMNDMHQDVVNNGNLTSTPGMAEGTPNLGDFIAGECCTPLEIPIEWIIIAILVVIIIIIPTILFWIRRRRVR